MKKRTWGIALICCLLVMTSFGGIVFALNWHGNSTDAATDWDRSSSVLVPEILGSPDNLEKLLAYMLGDEISYPDFKRVLSSPDVTISSILFRESTYGGKKNTQDIQVTFGGKNWQVVYFSKAKNGDPIVTLMAPDVIDLPRSVQDQAEGKRICWGRHSWRGDYDASYPPSLYGASYIRAVINNYGKYSTGPETLADYYGDDNYVLRDFTAAGQYSRFLEIPANIPWQEYQYSSDIETIKSDLPNEGWGDWENGEQTWKKLSNSWWTSKLFYNENHGAWKNDYLWLASVCETANKKGIWRLSDNQRAASEIVWLRSARVANYDSGPCADDAWRIHPNGTEIDYEDVGGDKKGAVRPCIHLNLEKLTKEAPVPSTCELYYTGTDKCFDKLPKNQRPSWYLDYMKFTYETQPMIEPGTYRCSVDYGTNHKQIQVVIRKAKINVSIDNAQSELNHNLTELSATISGEISSGLRWQDLIRLTTTADPNVSGKYQINAETIDDDHYEVVIIKRGTYTVGNHDAEIWDAYDDEVPTGWMGYDLGQHEVTIKPD